MMAVALGPDHMVVVGVFELGDMGTVQCGQELQEAVADVQAQGGRTLVYHHEHKQEDYCIHMGECPHDLAVLTGEVVWQKEVAYLAGAY